MKLGTAQKVKVYNKVKHFVDMGNKDFYTDLEMPTILFKKRGTVGGTACYSRMELNLNAGLMLDNWDEYMNQVIPHEVAHLLKEHMYGRGKSRCKKTSAHGSEWKRVMRALGVSPDRTHNMDVSKVAIPKSKYIYNCDKCGSEVIAGPKIHKKIQLFGSNYGHRGCSDSKIIFNRDLGKVTNRQAAEKKLPSKKVKTTKVKTTKADRPKEKEPKAGTKMAHALVVYRSMKTGDMDHSRKDIIQAISQSMQVTEKRAGQLYSACRFREGA